MYDETYNEQRPEAALTARDNIRTLFKHKWTILIAFATVVAVVYLGLQLRTPVYEAKVKMLITAQKQVESPYYRQIAGNQADEITMTQAEIVRSNPVLEWAVNALNLQTRSLDHEKDYASPLKARLIEWQVSRLEKKLDDMPKQARFEALHRRAVMKLKSNLEVEPIRGTNLFNIIISDVDPLVAARLANVVARSYVIFDLKQQLVEVTAQYGNKHPKVMVLNEMIKNVSRHTRGEQVTDIEAIGPASVKIVEQAAVPTQAAGRPDVLILALAIVMGLFLGIVLAFVFEYTDQSVRGPMDIEQFLDIPHLGAVAKKGLLTPAVARKSSASGDYAASYRQLADQLYLIMKDKQAQSLMLAAPSGREGNSVAALNLAKFFAEYLKLKVLLVDANLRNPSLAKMLKQRTKPGLAELASGEAVFKDTLRNAAENLDVIAGGKTDLNPITIFELSNMPELISSWKKDYDVILFDAPNFRDYKDAYVLAELVDEVALVVAQGVTRRAAAKYVINSLRKRKVDILGAILTERVHYIPQFVYDRV